MNVGDYVRDHIYGIGKIIKCYDNELEIVFKKSRIKTSISSYFEFNLNKSSSQIIDLIEIEDYVNGYKVVEIVKGFKILVDKLELDTTTGLYHHKSIMAKNIKTIVTHEQMEAMQYRVEE
jgi:hypothetical protein